MTNYEDRGLGWLPQLPDSRDIPYLATRPQTYMTLDLPPAVDLRVYCPPVFDQGHLGSCTANATIAAYEMATLQSGIDLSRLFLYYNSRALEGTTSVDAGAFIRDAIKSAANTGVCLESYWMYKPELFAESPPLDAYEEALNHQAIIYAAVEPNSQAVMLALADGFPVVFGFTVYDGFYRPEVSEHGILSMPTASERVVGGHACLIVGYDRAAQRFIVRNSWGEAFGDQGYFSIPFSYVESLASDFWVIKKVE